jgi:hypothetical protein
VRIPILLFTQFFIKLQDTENASSNLPFRQSYRSDADLLPVSSFGQIELSGMRSLLPMQIYLELRTRLESVLSSVHDLSTRDHELEDNLYFCCTTQKEERNLSSSNLDHVKTEFEISSSSPTATIQSPLKCLIQYSPNHGMLFLGSHGSFCLSVGCNPSSHLQLQPSVQPLRVSLWHTVLDPQAI